MEVGKDLNIESLQDKETYDEKNNSSGFNFSVDVSHAKDLPASYENAGITGGKNKGNTNSNYESVTDQAGIYAGKGGFDIEAGKNTDLKGAVIASETDASKNKLSTDTLTYSDIENKAEYEASSSGVAYDSRKYDKDDPNYKNQGATPVSGTSSSDNADSTTKSAIADGTIEIRSNPQQNITNLSRNTQNVLNALDKIFARETVAEQQELAQLFGQVAFKAIGDLGLKEGSPEKAALDIVFGGIMTKVGGGKFAEGAASAGLTQLVMNELKNIKDPALLQWATAIVGAAAAKIVNGNAQTGASVAISETKNNNLGHLVLEIPGMKELLAATGIVIAIDAGVQVLKNEAGEVIATWSAEVGGWVSSTGEWLGNSFSEMKDWAYDIYLSSDIKDVVEKGNPTDNHSTTDGSSLPKEGEPNSSVDLLNPDGSVKQRRYYDKDGNAFEDIDYNHSNGDGSHTFPHRHKWKNGRRE